MKKTSAVLDVNCERSADAIGEAVSQKLLADARQIIDTARKCRQKRRFQSRDDVLESWAQGIRGGTAREG